MWPSPSSSPTDIDTAPGEFFLFPKLNQWLKLFPDYGFRVYREVL
ncbi:hypothetical protein D082_12240 [Synechocystis sp. PCC 6714]|nr:hypothetical protein D082_12240 [Synechocystis sp. PCC 6714]